MRAAMRGNTTTAHRRGRPDLSQIADPLRPLAVPLDQLRPDPSNARRHPERNLEAVKESLRRWEQYVGKKAVKAT
jgi:hypothetical protein